MFVLHKVIQWYIYKQLASTKTKQASNMFQYMCYPFAPTHMVNSYVSKMCIQIIANIYGFFFYSRLLILARNLQKLMHGEYYFFYSTHVLTLKP